MKSKEKTTPITARLTEAEKELLYNYAAEADMSVSQVVRKAIKVYLAAKTQKKGK